MMSLSWPLVALLGLGWIGFLASMVHKHAQQRMLDEALTLAKAAVDRYEDVMGKLRYAQQEHQQQQEQQQEQPGGADR